MTAINSQNSMPKFSRPWPITLLCVVGCLICLQIFLGSAVVFIFQNVPAQGYLIAILLLLNCLCYGGGVLGYWKMRRWGVYFYAFGSLMSIAVAKIFGWHLDFKHYLIPIIFIGTGMIYFRKMK